MKFNKAYKFRLYPTKKQIGYIEGCFNACRYVYNVSLDCEKQLYELGATSNLSAFGLVYHLKYYKIKDEWLNKYDSMALEFEMHNLSDSYKKFFKGAGFPKFKRKYDRKQSFRTRQNIEVLENAIKIPKLKEPIETVIHREIEGKPKQMTIFRENDKYYVSIMVEIEKEIPNVNIINKEVGIDTGIIAFATFSDGRKIDNPKFLKQSSEYMKTLQQKLAKAKKGSNNHKKLKKKISNLHEKIKNKRNLFLHEESRKIVNEFDRIFVENLNVKGMSATSRGTIEKPGKMVKQKSGLNRNILDTAPASFVSMLEYKTKFDGKEIGKVNKFYASSKICSCCDHKKDDLTLADRIWTCEKCGTEHDRDVNAAKNILVEGRRSLTLVK